MFIALLSFSGFLASIHVSLNNKSSLMRPTLIDLNPPELYYYPLMISLDKCSGSCNFDDLSTKICVLSKTEDINVKVFNMTTNKMKLKPW